MTIPRVQTSGRAEVPGHLWAIIEEWIGTQHYRVSQAQIASKVGVPRSTMTDWKYGRRQVGVVELARLADEIRQPLERLVDAVNRDMGYKPSTIAGYIPPHLRRGSQMPGIS